MYKYILKLYLTKSLIFLCSRKKIQEIIMEVLALIYLNVEAQKCIKEMYTEINIMYKKT